MILTNMVQDDTMAVPGFEHQTFMCSVCHDMEQRFVFSKQNREPMAEHTATSATPVSKLHEEHVASLDPSLIDSAKIKFVERTEPVKATVQPESTQMESTIRKCDPEAVLRQEPSPVLPASTAESAQAPASDFLINGQEGMQNVLLEPTKTAAAPREVIQSGPVGAALVIQASETVVEATQTVVQQAIQNRQPDWATRSEKLHTLNGKLVTRDPEEVEKRAQFKRFWDSLLSIPSPSTGYEELSCEKADQSIAAQTPTAPDEPSCVPLAQLADSVTPDAQYGGIISSGNQLSSSSEPLSHVTSEKSVWSSRAGHPPPAQDEPSEREAGRERRRRWWSWKELVR